MANTNMHDAKNAKDDEFYTMYEEIQREVNSYLEYDANVFKDKTILLPCDDPEWSNFTKFFAQNFEKFQLKKLISTSYAIESKSKECRDWYQPTLFETESPKFDKEKTSAKGKIFILDRDSNKNGKIDIEDLTWDYMDGDGDFRSNEVKKLRDEADVIVTNPPFSLFREFVAWIMEANKKFLIIGNMNSVSCKEIFPLFMENKIWAGVRFHRRINGKNMMFLVPNSYGSKSTELEVDGEGNKYISVSTAAWFTNLEHGRRHQPLQLMSMEDNLKFNKKLLKKLGEFNYTIYPKYDNYDAIEVPYTNAIPSDYDGVMGVPISFLDKYNPDQFEILGSTQRDCHDLVPDTKKYDSYWEVKPDGKKTGSSGGKTNENANLNSIDGKHNYFINEKGDIVQSLFTRIFIKHKK